jgi:hypothetical protein
MAKEKLYLVALRLYRDADDRLEKRIKEDVPIFNDTLMKLSNGNVKPALSAYDGSVLLWVLASQHDAKHILNQLYTPGDRAPRDWRSPGPVEPSGSKTNDQFLVVELGLESCTTQNVISGWLDRVRKTL